MRWRKSIWDWLNVDPTLPFEYRQTILVATAASLLAFTATLTNVITAQPLEMTIVTILAGFLLVWVRAMVPKAKNLTFYILLMSALGIILGTVGWLTSAGIYGSAPYVFFLSLAWLLVITDYRKHLLLVAGLGLPMGALVILQFLYPNSVAPYPDENARNIDLVVGIIATLIFLALSIRGLRRQFQDERENLATKNAELVTMSHKLAEARDKATDALEARSNFFAAMSHELRTPLTSVIAGSRLLRISKNAAQRDEVMTLMERSARQLLRLIDDILVLRSSEAGEISIVAAAFNLHDFLGEISDFFQLAAKAKGLEFRFKIGESVPRFIRADSARLDQVLANLLSNAIKYTNSGFVVLEVGSTAAGNEILFAVKDSGAGISSQDRENLFKPFARAHDVRRRYHGSGLGLSVCAALAQRLGGSIELERTDGTGSTFIFRLPAVIADGLEDTAKEPNRAQSIAGKKILIAEDDEISAILLSQLLESHRAQAKVVSNGSELLNAATSDKWDAILTDIQMPELDGFAATEKIVRHLGRSGPPIIAVSASTFEEERDRANAVGIADWITKPYTEKVLLDTLQRHL